MPPCRTWRDSTRFRGRLPDEYNGRYFMKSYGGRIPFVGVTRPTPQYAQGYDRRGTDGKPAFTIRSQHFTAVDDSLVLCRFTSERGFGLFVEEPYARMIRSVTGWDMGMDELERVINLERLFNGARA